MRRIIILIMAMAALWMGWWVIGSSALERSLTAWIEERRAEGWVADYSELGVRGFPNRFDTRISDIRLADPATGIAWSAPFLEILQLSYRPNSAIIALPDVHLFSTPLQNIQIETSQARGSLTLRPVPSLELDRSTIVLEDLALTSTSGWQTTSHEARISAQRAEPENTYRFGIEVLGLAPSEALVAALDPAGILPASLQRLRLDATLALTAPLDRAVIEDARPQITAIDLDDLSARWGDVLLRAAGELTVDAAGVPRGEITLRAEEWRKLLEMAIASGALNRNAAPLLEGTIALMAGLGGDPDNLDAVLNFRDGRILLGPIPLGPAPRIVLR